MTANSDAARSGPAKDMLTSDVETALRQSEERYRAVVEDQTEIISRFTADGTFTFVNEVFCRFFGKTSEELVGSKWQPIPVADDLPVIKERLGSMSPANPVVVIENRVYSGRGEVRWMQFVNRGFYDAAGRLSEIQAVGRDVTERKQTQDVLRQNRDELQAIYDGLVEGVIIADAADAKIIRANRAFCRMVGWPDEDACKITPELVHPPEVLPRVWEHLEAVKKGSVARLDDLPFLRKDGQIVYADAVSSPICYNQRPAWISLFHDVTDRHRAHESLKREQQALWHMLQASDHERQLISYEIHDGLAQYLAAAAMQLHVYERLLPSRPEDAQKAIDAAMQLVNQSHREARRLISEVRPPVIDEVGLASAISHLVHEQRERGGPNVKFDSDVQFKRLSSALENSLYRIAQEAVTNACKHSRSPNVTVTLAEEGREVRLAVQDWGCGFDSAAVEKGHFGLEGIRQRVRLLGGRLTIQSAPGAGTLIEVILDAVSALGPAMDTENP